MRRFDVTRKDVLAAQISSYGKLSKWYLPDERLFIKLSSRNANSGEYMFESVSEVLSGLICGALGFKEDEYVSYELCEVAIDGKPPVTGCVSANFLCDEEYYLPMGELVSASKYFELARTSGVKMAYRELTEHLKRVYELPNIKRNLDRMFLIDNLILNRDRHFDNFGLISLINGFKAGLVFDCGAGFFGDMFVEYETAESLLKEFKSNPFRCNFNDQLYLIDPENTADLSFDGEKIASLIDDFRDFISLEKGEVIKEILENRLCAVKKWGL
ncbi:hypothetical protein AGMMS49975_23700 [Clostridia bacterium]|nr:hypothetical protein AGMMS49975_23700 [Clostridia bacterium]